MRNETQPEIPEDGYITGYLRWYYEFDEFYHQLKQIRDEQNREMWNGRSDDDNIYFEYPWDGKE
jgi:hypothetical protein